MDNNTWLGKGKRNIKEFERFKEVFNEYVSKETSIGKTINKENIKPEKLFDFKSPQLTNNVRVFLDDFELNYLELNLTFSKYNLTPINNIELLIEQTNGVYLDFENLNYKNLIINFYDLDGSISKQLNFDVKTISVNTNIKVKNIETLKYKINITF